MKHLFFPATGSMETRIRRSDGRQIFVKTWDRRRMKFYLQVPGKTKRPATYSEGIQFLTGQEIIQIQEHYNQITGKA